MRGFKEIKERPVERFGSGFDPDRRIGSDPTPSNSINNSTSFDPDKRIVPNTNDDKPEFDINKFIDELFSDDKRES